MATGFAAGLDSALNRIQRQAQFDERMAYNNAVRLERRQREEEQLEREARARQLAGIADFLNAARTRADGTTISDEEVLRNNPQIADIFNQLVGRGGPYERQFQTVPGVTRQYEGFSQGPDGRVVGRVAQVDEAGNVVSRGPQTVNGETGPNAKVVAGRNASEVLAPIDLYLAQNVPGYAGRLQQREERNLAAQRENQSRADLGTFAGIFSPDRVQGGQVAPPQGQGAGAISPDDLIAAAQVPSVGDAEAAPEIDAVTSAAPVVSPPTPGPTPAPTARPAPTPAPQATPRPTPAPSMQERKAAVAAGAERAAGNDPTARKGAKILAETPTAGGQATVDRAAKVHEESVLPKLQRAEDRGRRFVILKDNERRAIQRLIVNSGKMPDASTLQMLATGKVYLDSDAAKQLKTVQSGDTLATVVDGQIVGRQSISGQGPAARGGDKSDLGISEFANVLPDIESIATRVYGGGEQGEANAARLTQLLTSDPTVAALVRSPEGGPALGQSIPNFRALEQLDADRNGFLGTIVRWIKGMPESKAARTYTAALSMATAGVEDPEQFVDNVQSAVTDVFRGGEGSHRQLSINENIAMLRTARQAGVPLNEINQTQAKTLFAAYANIASKYGGQVDPKTIMLAARKATGL